MMLTSFLALCGPWASEPRPEVPRPDLERAAWVSLNGPWEFAFDPDGTGTARGLQQPGSDGFGSLIVVPYPWESRLSGLAATDYHGVAWYRRSFHRPAGWNRRAHLCFGAVDWVCQVWVNGYEVGSHVGGYTPFRCDVTDVLQDGENVVVVRVRDDTDPQLPVGKQVRWYTTTSGLWQSVWLEDVPPTHVTDLAVDSQLDPPQATVTVGLDAAVGGDATLTLDPRDEQVPAVKQTVKLRPGRNEVELVLPVPGGQAWTPEHPQLYDYQLSVEQAGATDQVQSYFGLRTIDTGAVHGQGYESILLNDQPVYLRGALHQVFNPEGVYTFPDDQAIRHDLELAKQLGWNFLRLHIKIVDPRFVYWADKLGVMLMCDMPNTWEYSHRARDAWELTMREALRRDRSHPSIIAWCDFNESWGIGGRDLKTNGEIQRWVAGMYDLTKQLDPTRLVEDNSPCLYDHVTGDLNSWHFYLDNEPRATEHIAHVMAETYPGSPFNFCEGHRQGTQPLLNSEYGAVSAGGGDRDVSWGFKYLTTLLRAQGKCQGYVYTEHCDIEWEHNGLVCYDRTPKVFGYDAFVPGMTPADLQGADFVGYHDASCREFTPGEGLELGWFVSHYSELDGPFKLRWRVHGWDAYGNPVDGARGEVLAEVSPAAVTEQEPLSLSIPSSLALGAVSLELLVGDQRVAANYVNLLTTRKLPAGERLSARQVALRFRPGAVAKVDAPGSPQLLAELEGDKLAALGRPSFGYRLQLPEPLRGQRFSALTLLLEAGARGGDSKLDWPQRRNAKDYPQTKLGRTTPSTLRVTFDGIGLGTIGLADDLADARGVLSHLVARDHGSCGQRVELRLDLTKQPALTDKLARGEVVELTLDVPAEAEQTHGLSLYGERMGRYVLPPTLLLEASDDLTLPADWRWSEPITVDELRGRRETIVATAEGQAPVWRYITDKPSGEWTVAEYDDGDWSSGKGGFGTTGTPNAIIGTIWNTGDIWLRHGFTLDRAPAGLDLVLLRLYHDEDVEVYLNGTQVLSRRGYLAGYLEEALDPELVREHLRVGENLLAVHCRQTIGGQNIDVGLMLLRGDSAD